jgi:hypothetical protein
MNIRLVDLLVALSALKAVQFRYLPRKSFRTL